VAPRGSIAAVQDEELVDRLAESLGIGRAEAARVVGEVVSYYHEPVEEFVRRRHAACQRRGIRNAQTYQLLARELRGRLVAAPELTERQIRRMIYG
jgi:hypothetical protein